MSRLIYGLPNRLKTAVANSGQTNKAIIRRTNIGRSKFYMILNGDAPPSVFEVMRICAELNISADWLLGINKK